MKPIILCFLRYYFPGYRSGGPPRSIGNLVEHLGDDFKILIFTSDRDVLDLNPYNGVELNTWNTVGKAKVFYATKQQQTLCGILSFLAKTKYDLIYLNSFWDPKFTILPLIARRLGLAPKKACVIAPRGEFSQGSLKIKANKKNLFLGLTRLMGLYQGLDWHASTEHEYADILRALPWVQPKKISIARNLVSVEDFKVSNYIMKNPKTQGPLRICFLSRITPKKNLDFALRVLALANSELVFTIYGPIEDQIYWEKCKLLINKMPANINVNYEGEIHPDRVKKELSKHDCFLFPTLGENFGHVIYEALKAGLILLISNRTPWTNIAEKGVGWDLSLKEEVQFAKKIDEISMFSYKKITSIRLLSYSYAKELASDNNEIEANRLLFSKALKLTIQ